MLVRCDCKCFAEHRSANVPSIFLKIRHDDAKIETILHHYRCFQLIVIAFNSVFALLNAVLHAAVTGAIVIFLPGAVRAHGLFSIFSAYVCLLSLIGYLKAVSTYAEINHWSNCLLTTARTACMRAGGSRASQSVGRKMVLRELMAMMKLGVKAGPFFYFDKPFVLRYIDIVLGLSVNLMIMY